MELSIGIKLLLSLLIGAAIGLEREIHEKHEEEQPTHGPFADVAFMGVRTLALTTVLGTIAGLLFHDYFSIFLLISGGLILLLAIQYVLSGTVTKDIGVTTEIATIYCYLIGVFIGLELFPLPVILAITVGLVLLLSNKDAIKSTVDHIKRRELQALISYAIISLVILPSLPNFSYTLSDIPYLGAMLQSLGVDLGTWQKLEIINPFTTWLVVTIFTGVEVLGYILERTFGKGRGLIISSLVGGFVSSTATTQSLATQSRKSGSDNRLVGAALLATFTSFFSVTLIILPINPFFVARLLPTLILLTASFAIVSITFLRMNDTRKNNELEKEERHKVFSLQPALIFAGLYLGIKILSAVALELFGTGGFLATSAIAGFAGIDAVAINIAQLYGSAIEPFTAVLAFLIVNAVNLMAKTIYIFLQGSKEMAWKYGVSVAVIVVFSFVGLLFV